MTAQVGSGAFGRGGLDQDGMGTVSAWVNNPLTRITVYSPRLGWIARRVPLSARSAILDVGCGMAQFLRLARRRFRSRCIGVELDPKFAEAEQPEGVDVRIADFESLDMPARFDLITMFQLIEHLNQPADALRKAWEMLKPGGYLYIETPAANSLAFKVFGKYWMPLFPPYHRHVFSMCSLRSLIGEVLPGGQITSLGGSYLPSETLFSLWLLIVSRFGSSPFNRRPVHPLRRGVGLALMGLGALVAAPVEAGLAASTRLLDSLTGERFLLASHQRLLVYKPPG
jgi:SAM-dependent methyltransferase